MADRKKASQELAKARNVFRQFRNTSELRTLSETFLAFEPEDESDEEFGEALGWAIVTITRQAIRIAAHEAVGGSARYQKRVKELYASLMRQHELECEGSSATEKTGERRPKLRVIPGGKR